jgi:CO/xanthine dehydrogenase Mo-binding subunit
MRSSPPRPSGNFDTYRPPRIDEAPVVETHLVKSSEAPGFGEAPTAVVEVEVAANGSLKVHCIVCAVDCGMVVNPDTIEAQVQGGTFFGLTAARYGAITLKNGRVEQGNFDTYRPLRIDEAPVGRNTSGQKLRGPRRLRRGPDRRRCSGGDECDLRRHGQAHPHPADRH